MLKKNLRVLILVSAGFFTAAAAMASGPNFNDTNILAVNSVSPYFSGNVGIGSASPAQKLDVAGTVKATAFAGDGTGITGIPGTITGLNAGYLARANSSTTIVDSGIYQNGSNVGIGTTSPAVTLQLGPAGRNTTTQYRLGFGPYDSALGYPQIIFNNPGTYFMGIGVDTAGGLSFGNAGDAGMMQGWSRVAMTVAQSGNVGIGLTTPAAKLQVAGGIAFDPAYAVNAGGDSILTLRNDTTSIYAGYQAGNAVTPGGLTNTALGYQALYHNTSGYRNVAIGYAALMSNLDGRENTAVGNGGLASLSSGFGNTAIGYTALNGMGAGIANTAVGMLSLEAVTSGGFNTALGYGAGLYQADGTVLTGATASVYIGYEAHGGNNSDDYSIVIGARALGLGAHTTVLGSSQTTLTALWGSVGIGTTAPASKLDLVGVGTTSATSNLILRDANKSALVTVLDNGYVGIGVTAPSHKLTIASGWISVDNGYGFAGKDTGGTSRALAYIASGTNSIHFGEPTLTGGNVIFDSPGNVGIGTTAPAAKLHVGATPPSGTADLSSNSALIKGNLEVDGKIYGDGSGLTNVSGGVSGLNAGYLSRANTSTTIVDAGIYQDAGGNIGVGTTAPVKKFEVTGGDVYINHTSSQLVMKKPDGTCAACGPNNADIWVCSSVACP